MNKVSELPTPRSVDESATSADFQTAALEYPPAISALDVIRILGTIRPYQIKLHFTRFPLDINKRFLEKAKLEQGNDFKETPRELELLQMRLASFERFDEILSRSDDPGKFLNDNPDMLELIKYGKMLNNTLVDGISILAKIKREIADRLGELERLNVMQQEKGMKK